MEMKNKLYWFQNIELVSFQHPNRAFTTLLYTSPIRSQLPFESLINQFASIVQSVRNIFLS